MSKRSLKARWVVPVAGPPIENGGVVLSEGRILAACKATELTGDVEDLGDAALLPGLVNAHTHLEFSDCETPLPPSGANLPAWIRSVIAERTRRNRQPAAAIEKGLAESLAHGVTTLAEIATQPSKLYKTVAPRPRLILLQEAIGFSAARVDSVYADILDRLEDCETPLATECEVTQTVAGLSPHAPYTVHPELLEQLVKLASQRRQVVAMHLAESPEELQLLAENTGDFRDLLEARSMWDKSAIPRRTRPLDYLRRLAKAERSLVVHGNYLSSNEIEFCAEQRDRMSVVYCPRTHAYFEHPTYPLAAMLKAGVRVTVGTDSRASNPDLSVLAELRAIARRHPEITHEQILKMGTLDAAESLEFAARIGSLSPGKQADIIAVPCSAATNPLAELLESSQSVSAVWLAGKLIPPSPDPP